MPCSRGENAELFRNRKQFPGQIKKHKTLLYDGQAAYITLEYLRTVVYVRNTSWSDNTTLYLAFVLITLYYIKYN